MISQPSDFYAIIVAAGTGSRTGLQQPKQFVTIAGKTSLQRCVDIFDAHPLCKGLIVALDAQHIETTAITSRISLQKVTGGQTRKDSVYNALQALDNLPDEALVLIHDAARPFLHHDDINALLRTLTDGHKAATLSKPVSDTLLREDGQRPERDGLHALQTPQAFRYALIMQAHRQAKPNATYTDDTALVTEMGESVKLVTAQHFNDKITYAQDITMAEARLSTTYETRTGQGFDVHAFEGTPSGKPLILCGVTVPHDKALSGHSDADVGLHTITDALLGALGEGDIGRHFPPSDPKFKDMDSAIFLEKARDILTEKGGAIVNIDLTLICEAPKITPHAPAMIARVAEILQTDQSRISIKATTTEKLGFTGRGEGIAAQAVATIKVPAP